MEEKALVLIKWDNVESTFCKSWCFSKAVILEIGSIGTVSFGESWLSLGTITSVVKIFIKFGL